MNFFAHAKPIIFPVIASRVKLKWIIAYLAISSSFFSGVYAHPLDISSSTFTIQGSTIEAITYFHPSQVEAIIGSHGINMRSLTYEGYYKYQTFLFEYLKTKVVVTDSENTACKLQNFSTQELGIDEIFTKGFPVSYSIACKSSIPQFAYQLNIFTELSLQTNRILWYDGKTGNPLSYKVLTAKISKAVYSSDTPKVLLDSDGDGLPDEEEVLYRTDPSKSDTDSDFYTDNEEVLLGWNPLSSEISPGQSVRRAYPDKPFVLPTGISQHANPSQNPSANTGSGTPAALDNTSQNDRVPANAISEQVNHQSFEIFARVLRYMEQIRKDDSLGLLLPTLGLLFVLGLLHALGPGHSKGFMAGYILSEGVGLSKSLSYAALFTAIHLSDIVIITLLAKFVFSTFDSSKYFSEIQQYASILLIIVALILFVTSLRKYGKKIPVSKNTSSGGLWMAFFAGLAPCTFAWSILLVLFAIGRQDLALPFILAFGLGVFVALSGVALVIFRLRERALKWNKRSAYILPMISSGLLLVLALSLAYRVFG